MEYQIAKAGPADEVPNHLLLLADENQELIDAYLSASDVYRLTIEGWVVGICLLQVKGEIMNIAVEPAYQGRGLGRALLNHISEVARQQGLARLVIKTGNSSIRQIQLYQQQGFDLVQVNYNYFLEHYPEPIWENGIQCRHQLVFEQTLDFPPNDQVRAGNA